MARARNIKPSFFANEELAECSFSDRLLFIGLWTLADREGRLEDRPKRIKGSLFPYDDVDVDAGLKTLEERGFILRYRAEGNRRCISIINFAKHQKPHHKEVSSEIPSHSETLARGKNKSRTGQGRVKHDSSMTQACGNEVAPCPTDSPFPLTDSPLLIPDTLLTKTGSSCEPAAKVQPGMIPIPAPLDVPAFRDAWPKWVAYLVERTGRPPVQGTLERQLVDLAAGGPSAAVATIENSIKRGYASLVSSKDPRNGQPEGTDPGRYKRNAKF